VSIVQARGLKHLNMTGDNMFCVCEVKRADRHAKPLKWQTKRVKKSLDPMWNETKELEDWHPGESLEFVVYDHGMIGSKTEGRAMLASERFDPNGFQGPLQIEGVPGATLLIRVAFSAGGESPFGLAEMSETQHGFAGTQLENTCPLSGCGIQGWRPTSAQEGWMQVGMHNAAVEAMRPSGVVGLGPQKLQVTIVRASGLEQLIYYSEGIFCTCTVAKTGQGSSTSFFQTKVLKGTLQPTWNETYEIDSWSIGDALEFAIFDKGMAGTRQEGVSITLASGSFYPQGFQGDLVIQGLQRHATLYVCVVPVGPSPAGAASHAVPMQPILTGCSDDFGIASYSVPAAVQPGTDHGCGQNWGCPSSRRWA